MQNSKLIIYFCCLFKKKIKSDISCGMYGPFFAEVEPFLAQK